MANHDFGIMKKEPMHNERFDISEPEKYNCIMIDDDFIEPILMDLQKTACYWHTIENENKGLAYCGITLIPTKSLDKFIEILLIQDKVEYTALISLANEAKKNSKYLIHFGI